MKTLPLFALSISRPLSDLGTRALSGLLAYGPSPKEGVVNAGWAERSSTQRFDDVGPPLMAQPADYAVTRPAKAQRRSRFSFRPDAIGNALLRGAPEHVNTRVLSGLAHPGPTRKPSVGDAHPARGFRDKSDTFGGRGPRPTESGENGGWAEGSSTQLFDDMALALLAQPRDFALAPPAEGRCHKRGRVFGKPSTRPLPRGEGGGAIPSKGMGRSPYWLCASVAIGLLLTLFLTGCAPVAAWERGTLAKPHMALDPNPLQSQLRQHNYGSREAGLGGSAGSGGGCGCY